jgi:hypothetical protein
LHELFRRIAHGFIVIDNRYQCLRHSVLRACRSAGARACLSATDAISYVSDKGMVRCLMWDGNHTSVWFVDTSGRFLQAGAGCFAS